MQNSFNTRLSRECLPLQEDEEDVEVGDDADDDADENEELAAPEVATSETTAANSTTSSIATPAAATPAAPNASSAAGAGAPLSASTAKRQKLDSAIDAANSSIVEGKQFLQMYAQCRIFVL